MRKSSLKVLSSVLALAMAIGLVPLNSNAESLTNSQKSMIGAGAGAGTFMVVGGIIYFASKAISVPKNKDADSCDENLQLNEDEKQVLSVLYHWCNSNAEKNKSAFRAALNLYCLKTCGCVYDIFDLSYKDLSDNYEAIRLRNKSKSSPYLEHIETVYLLLLRAYNHQVFDKKKIKIAFFKVVKALTPILKSSPGSLSGDMNLELETIMKGDNSAVGSSWYEWDY